MEFDGTREAMLYEKVPESGVRCVLCAHRCLIAAGRVGVCQVRENQAGRLVTHVYGRVIARHVDPVEKKPLFHFYPGSRAYSIATPGCNFRCRWCQNADISQLPREQAQGRPPGQAQGRPPGQAQGLPLLGEEMAPEQIVADAQRTACRSIAYTYTEPTIFFEYSYDTARLAHQSGVANVYVTNGYMTREMLEAFHPYLDAANVDLKAFRDETYRKLIGARLGPILDNLKIMKRLGIWVEVTTLIIPGINDDEAELCDVAGFIATELGQDTPWHISRFFPAYRMREVPSTPLSTLQRAGELGHEAGLRYVYAGNQPGEANTMCHACGHVLVRRSGFWVLENHVRAGATCPQCGSPVAGVGMDKHQIPSSPRDDPHLRWGRCVSNDK
jgi:pyruvate formate lyase activating enzyme